MLLLILLYMCPHRYVLLRDSVARREQRSHLVRNNQDPHWNFQAEFFVIDVEGTVEVTIYDKSHSAGNEDEDKAAVTFVGAASLCQ
jgi:hypothetical protein